MQIATINFKPMIWLIFAQIARAAVIWTTNAVGRKILKTIVVGSVTFYLVDRHNQFKNRLKE